MRNTFTILAFAALALSGCDDDDDPSGPITPQSGSWTGNGLKFYVAAGGTRITATGSTLIDSNNAPFSLQLGPVTCNPSLMRTFFGRGEATITNNAFTMSSANDWSVSGTFTSATSASGTFTVSNGSECNLTGTWTATHDGD